MGTFDKQASIALVLPYFGRFNNYFPLFLESCRQNPTVDWLIYTDSEQEYDWPENVKVRRMTFEAFRERAQRCFDFHIRLEQPYKLCDFKPAYGEILQEDLAGYDFWGHCDCDLIFGDIRRFITEEVTARYDKILDCGHLTLYRNTPEVCAYYRTQSQIDYRQVYGAATGRSFDEWPGVSGCWRRDGRAYFGALCYDDVVPGAGSFRLSKETRGGYVGPYHGQPDESRRFRRMCHTVYIYQDGHLERCWLEKDGLHAEETLYVHLQKRSMRVEFPLENGKAPNRFWIVPDAFLPEQRRNAETLRRLAPRRPAPETAKERLRKAVYILRAELRNIGKKGFCGESYFVSLIRSIFRSI